jgi:hypothetical protein
VQVLKGADRILHRVVVHGRLVRRFFRRQVPGCGEALAQRQHGRV